MTKKNQQFTMIWACMLAAILAVPAGMTLISGDTVHNPEPAAVNGPQLDTITIQPNATVGKDAWIGDLPNHNDTNFGSSEDLQAGVFGGPETVRGLWYVDMPAAPVNVINANLQLYSYNQGSGGVNISLFPLSQPWVEGEVTWNNRSDGNPWTPTGGDYDITREVYLDTTIINCWYSFDITGIVNDWLDGTISNYGLILIGNNNTAGEFVRFHSSDYTIDPTLVPKLTLTYSAEIDPPVPAQTFNEDDPARTIDLSGRGNGTVVHESNPGNGFNNIPFFGASANQMRAQYIYFPSEVGAEGKIRGISFNRTNILNTGNFSNFKIFLAHTDLNQLTATFANNYNGYLIETFSEANVMVNSSNKDSWIHFDLNDNFTYDSAHNLLIDIQWNGDGGSSISLASDTTVINRRVHDTTGAATGFVQNSIPVIRFGVDVVDNGIVDNGTGSTFWPFDPNTDASSRYQMLYNQSLINQSGIIDKICFQASFAGDDWHVVENLSIRMAHSQNDSLGTVFEANKIDGWTEVFNKSSYNLSYASTPEWVKIDIDNTFTYNNIDNLLIDIRWLGGHGKPADLGLSLYCNFGAWYGGLLREPDYSATTGTSWNRVFNLQTIFADSANLTWSATSSDPALFTAAISGGHSLVITPVADASGTGSVHLTLHNSDGGSTAQDIPITINAVNDDPVLSGPTAVSCTEDVEFLVNMTNFVSDIDSPLDAMTYTANSYTIVNGSEITFLYPEGIYQDNVTITVNDGDGGSDTIIVPVTITPVNDAPEFTGYVNTFNCDATVPKTYTVHPDDEETVTGQLSIYTDSQYATVNGQTISFLYPKGIGTDTVTIYLVDGNIYGSQNNISYNLAVTINDHPEITAHSPNGTDVPVTTTITITFDMAMNHTKAQNAFTMTLGTEEINGTFSWNAGNTTMTFTPSHVLTNGLYDVSVGASAESQTGFRMLSGYDWNFTAALGDYDGDGDGMPDQYEIDNGLDPETDDAQADLDNDGMPNIYEYDNNLDPAVDDALADADGDGATNIDEYTAGTDPADPNDTPSSIPWLMMLLVIIVIVVLIVVVLLMMKRKQKPQQSPTEWQEPGQQEPAPEEFAYQEPASDAVPPPPQAEEVIQSPEELPPPPPEY